MTVVETPAPAGEKAAIAAPAISARDLVKTYKGGVRALDGVSFDVPAGTIFGLLGPNGAGKSTTVKILTTLSRPDSGTGVVDGHDVVRQPDAVRKTIGVVGQKSGVDREATGSENLSLQGHIYGMRGAQLSRRVDELLHQFGLADAGHRIAKTYSGGMQRRLDIAMGLVHRPTVLFLDEPTTGLDPEVRADLWEEISRLARQQGLTILLTTHYLEEADRLASNLAILDRGRVVVEGHPEELKARLGGDGVRVELADPFPDPEAPELEGVGGVRDVQIRGRLIMARATDGPSAVPPLLAALEERGIRVATVSISRPSLDDVYLRYAGRSFEEAEREAEPTS